MMEYAELAAATNFTFLRGASHPHEMVEAAKALGLSALAITDRNTLAGVVRAHLAAREAGIKLLIGARLVTVEGVELICLPRNKDAYGALARLLTDANFRAADQEREGRVTLADVAGAGPDQVLILIPPAAPDPEWQREVSAFLNRCESPVEYGLVRHFDGQDGARLARQTQEAADWDLVPVALGDVLFHGAERREMADILTCIREHERIDTAGRKLAAHAERHLKNPQEMARLFAGYEAAVARSAQLAARIDFSLDELVYEYPEEVIGEGETPMQTLTRLTWEGADRRYPAGVPDKVRTGISYELGLIEALNYPSYFLTVHDLVRFARSKGILCQGRGSAANSSVCFALGVTEVDPATIDLLFERFVSAERNEPPDIDVDFEHQRREEVIQYVYEKYGRRRAGMTAVVSCYRPRGAIREVGKVFGLTGDVLAALSKAIWGWKDGLCDNVIRHELGLDPSSPALARTLHHARELLSFPRHLSQHPGGFVMTLGRLDEIVPVRKAAMPERTAIEWDKEDIEALGLMKVDVLGLGMLSCVSRALAMLEGEYGRKLALADVPGEDTRVYDMICKADTIGVFQIESRAQMTMLPRLRPRTFYDLVIEVAIVRPGPIQGDMVHPYLRRRDGKEKVDYPSEALRQVLEKTMGVPLFQEQAMKIAIVAAGFSPAEADRLRRSMAAFRRSGTIAEMGDRLIRGMVANGYERDFAERCFKQLEGFGEYGFPESHAASFALIVYVSCWLKFHYPDLFLTAMLNAQPLGFYAPAQLVRDAREHGVIVRPPDINHSAWDCTLEAPEPGERTRLTPEGGGARAVRLGLRQIKGLSEVTAARLVAAREQGGAFCSMDDMVRRARLSRGEADRLARGDALRSLSLDRRAGGWQALAVSGPDLPLFAEMGEGHSPAFAVQDAHGFCLPQMSAAEHVVADYAALSLSLKAHPVSFLREDLHARGYQTCAALKRVRNGARLGLSGLVLIRQRPGTASGVIFITLEDETGVANLVVWPSVFHRFRRVVIGAKMIGVTGRVQREGEVIHLIAEQLIDQTGWLSRLTDDPFEGTLARADEVSRSSADARMKPRRHGALAPAGPALPKSRDFH